ncbi:MAG: transcription elongation factor GreA [Lachnospiraceae bacterium]|nr:transcription elongation factor GreA [Lachnospiraceae bacterium]
MNNELTRKDIEDMEAEIEHRKVVVRKELLEHVKEARSHGDLSENFEYYAAKKEKNKNEGRIRYLERMIRTANIVEDNSKDDEVGINKTITVYVEEDDCEEEYKIVTTVREDSLSGLVSNESPMGKALLGHKVGDRVEIVVNKDYSYFVVIRKIDNSTINDSESLREF